MSRFIVLVDSREITEPQRTAYTEEIKKLNVAWWHWIPDAWLIEDDENKYTAQQVRELAQKSAPGVTIVVTEFDQVKNFALFGPSKSHEWMKKSWSPKGS